MQQDSGRVKVFRKEDRVRVEMALGAAREAMAADVRNYMSSEIHFGWPWVDFTWRESVGVIEIEFFWGDFSPLAGEEVKKMIRVLFRHSLERRLDLENIDCICL
ncbi:MAG: hypothetical protein ABIC19_04540 [Patescibacteria group bacterium]